MSDPRHNEVDMTDEEVIAMNSPNLALTKAWWPSVPHYYGDGVRQLMLGAATLMLVAAPLYGSNLSIEFPFILAGAITVVALAAFANAKHSWTAVANAIATGVGVPMYATWGVFEYSSIDPVAFTLRLFIAALFLFAFYFSMKTVRAFMLGQIGKRGALDEFDDEFEKVEQSRLEEENK